MNNSEEGGMISNEEGGSGGVNNVDGDREQDRYLPIANIIRIMKKALPNNAKVAKDAKETVQDCVSEFISFITSEASEKCQVEKRKTINGEDIIAAMTMLGFDNYTEPLRVYLSRFREHEKNSNHNAKRSPRKVENHYNNNNNNNTNSANVSNNNNDQGNNIQTSTTTTSTSGNLSCSPPSSPRQSNSSSLSTSIDNNNVNDTAIYQQLQQQQQQQHYPSAGTGQLPPMYYQQYQNIPQQQQQIPHHQDIMNQEYQQQQQQQQQQEHLSFDS